METLIDLIEEASARHGEREALRIRPGFRTRAWTYAEVRALVPRVASRLRDAGLQPGERVLLWAVSRPEWAIAYLATLWAEGVVVPLDFRSTDDLAARVAAQVTPRLVLSSLPTRTAASRLELPSVPIETLVDSARLASPLPRPNVSPEALAEVVFTSGTTGEPKGVMLTHANIATNAAALRSVVPLGTETRLLSILPHSHMYGLVPGLLAPLIAGARVVYPTSLQPSVLARTVRENKVTMLLAVPQVLKLLNNAVERRVDADGKRATFERAHRIARHLPLRLRRLVFRQVLREFGGALRFVAVGGAAMSPVVARRWEEMGVTALQGYGASECSPVVTFTHLEHNIVGTVGQVIPGVEIQVASDAEVLVRGPNVFSGYWQRPELTSSVLRDGWYHTGDLGTIDSDGFLTLRGRKKDMLVLADGTKVFPEDVESALIRDPRVRECAVVGLERPGADPQVHAVLILSPGADASDVVRVANAQLGAHQQIRGHATWPDEDLPRNSSMKVQKQLVLDWLLSEGASAPSATPAGVGADHSSLELLVARLDGVNRDAIRPDARLSSDLGLDSLGRVELLGLVEEELGAYIDDGDLEPETTVAELQARIDAAAGAKRAEGIYGWPLNPVVRGIGLGVQQLLARPLLWLLYRRRVRGLEHLRGLQRPVLFAANHHHHNDNPIIMCALPLRWRWHLSIAGAADDIFGVWWRGLGAAVLGNAFPMAREGAVRRSLELLGARLDRGFNVLIYPEGHLRVGGPLQQLRAGTGLVAIQGAVPVVPIRLRVLRFGALDTDAPPSAPRGIRGEVEVVFGAPLRFPLDTDPAVATEQLQAALEAIA